MPQLKPKDIYICESHFSFNEDQLYSLIACYLPIVGTFSISLYEFFAYQKRILDKGSHLHREILNHLDTGLKDFIEAREKLEALGLLETYWQEEKGYLYLLKPPLQAKEFLQDEIFSQLLMDRIGQEAIKELVNFQKTTSGIKEGYTSLTVKFQNKFPLSLKTMEANKKITNDIQQELVENNDAQSSFDWPFFKEMIEKHGIFINRFDKDKKEELVRIVDVYGLDEISLAHLVMESSDLITGDFDLNNMKNLLMASFNQTLKPKKVTPQVKVSENTRVRELKEKGFSNQEIQFIKAVEAYSPLQFLQISKKNLGGYVTTEEQKIIENLHEKHVFPSSVINILIDYVLRMNKNGSLSKTYVDRIANNWAQEKIQSPEEAILKVRSVIKEASKPKASKKAPLQVKEKLPDWVKKPIKETNVNKEKAKAFEEKIKQLREKNNRE